MSRVIWQKLLVPDESVKASTLMDDSYKEQVENVCLHPWANADIVCPDRKAFRSMSRASLFLSHVCMHAKEALAPYLSSSPFSVGIYCAVENGPIDAASTVQIIASKNTLPFYEAYRKFRNPKLYLKQLPNLAPAQMGISMGLQGAMNVYTHSTAGSLHALEQAEWDLHDNRVQAALVCTAHAFDDFLVVKRTRHFDPRQLVEGAGALLLVRDETKPKNWTSLIKRDPVQYFGISDPIIQLLKEEQHV